jgi:dihydrofolate synthase/folylpolyglutamate synthase
VRKLNYTEAVEYIYSIPKFTTKNKLEHTVEFMNRLGHPERQMKIIHVAGTNGKGSVCAFLSSILTLAGKRTGLFTSPHLVKINERFQINNEPVTDEEFLDAYLEVDQVVKSMVEEGLPHPTYFELLYAVSMVLFRKKEVEYVVLETGLGGRLDATNTVEHPIATVITSISLDHTEILGDTIEKIAFEKAGIIKPGVPVIYDAGNEAAEKVILKRARELSSPAFPMRPSMYKVFLKSDKSIDFYLDCGYYEHTRVTVPYLADYQMMNSSLALLAMEAIDRDHAIPLETRLLGIRKTRWQGRMETVMPGVVLDGAHNAAGVEEFVRTVQQVEGEQRVVMLFAAVVEKNYEKMIATICQNTHLSAVVVTEIKGDRIVPAEELATVFRKYTNVPVTAVPDIQEAFEEALHQKEEGILFCAGSLYLVGELKGILAQVGGTDD